MKQPWSKIAHMISLKQINYEMLMQYKLLCNNTFITIFCCILWILSWSQTSKFNNFTHIEWKNVSLEKKEW
jgi:hypothetical protein